MQPTEQPLPTEIDVAHVKQLRDSGDEFVLLDCREPAEWEIASIEGGLEVPMAEIPSRVGELEGFRTNRIVVYCHHGMRSQMVCEWLRGQGFARTQNMSGGIDAWSAQIDASVPRY